MSVMALRKLSTIGRTRIIRPVLRRFASSPSSSAKRSAIVETNTHPQEYSKRAPYAWDDWDFGGQKPIAVAPVAKEDDQYVNHDLLNWRWGSKNISEVVSQASLRSSAGSSSLPKTKYTPNVSLSSGFKGEKNREFSSSNLIHSKTTPEKLVSNDNCRTLIDYMPFGMHKGKSLRDLPRQYCLWLRDKNILDGYPSLYSSLVAHGKFEEPKIKKSAECTNTARLQEENKSIQKMLKNELILKLEELGCPTDGLKPVLVKRLRDELDRIQLKGVTVNLKVTENPSCTVDQNKSIKKMLKNELIQKLEMLGYPTDGLKPVLIKRLQEAIRDTGKNLNSLHSNSDQTTNAITLENDENHLSIEEVLQFQVDEIKEEVESVFVQ